ncbi:MAG: Fe-S protein assembly chaperone HscA [Acidobacteriota bacterium]|nr:Fe-S protein assembly chaperone HscA [Blastocatellia bacterium]MDW8413272.1 Fe-S protein assembly chaperone HscA [Acidobacteriota bacterium]
MRVVGIDLGTTNSLVAYVDDGGNPQIIPDSKGRKLVPSVVHYSPTEGLIVGEEARSYLITDPENTIYSIKRFMGKGAADVKEDLELLHFRLAEDSQQVVRFHLGQRILTPPEISALILKQLKLNAEMFFGEPVEKAVITVPAYFNDAQRQATKDAGRLAGLEVLRIVNEPTAASLAYGLDKREDAVIAVYDLGGGTFDISILKLRAGIFEVLATNGDTHLGGDDFDHLLINLLMNEIKSRYGVSFAGNPEAIQTCRRFAIELKHRLSEQDSAQIEIDLGTDVYRRIFTRAEFEALIAPLVERTCGPCRQAMKDAGVRPEDIDEVVLVGGSTRVPLVRRRVEELFQRPPHIDINPDEVVALGAAIQADILTGRRRNTLLLDVTPLSLGIETIGGVMTKLIMRNSTIPASASEMFTTYVDNQTGVDIHVLQGEREMAADCRSLARFTLKVPPMPAGLPRIEVKFVIDANGILNVTARDVRTDKEHSVEVKPSYGLTEEQVEKMLMDSIEYAEQDFAKRMFIEASNEAESVLRSLDKALADPLASELTAEELGRIDSIVSELKRALQGSDHRPVRAALKKLNEATMRLAELMMNRAVNTALKNKKLAEVQ